MSPGPKAVRITPVKKQRPLLFGVLLEVIFGFYEVVILFLVIFINIFVGLFDSTTNSNVNDSEDNRFFFGSGLKFT